MNYMLELMEAQQTMLFDAMSRPRDRMCAECGDCCSERHPCWLLPHPCADKMKEEYRWVCSDICSERWTESFFEWIEEYEQKVEGVM